MKVAIVVVAILGSALAASIKNDVSKIPPFRRMIVNPLELPNANPHLGIINGKEVIPHSIPYQIYVLGSDSDDDAWACGASLITPKYALTAAHCLYEAETITLTLGAHNLNLDDNLVVVAKSFKTHEKFNPDTIDNDIGIIELPNEVTLSETIGLATLPSATDDDLVGLQGRISGWGITGPFDDEISDVLREANSTIISNADCRLNYRIISDNHVCLSSEEGKATCSGDSGGPMVVGNNQVGITSFGAAGCVAYPTVYTRVAQYLDWIKANSNYKST